MTRQRGCRLYEGLDGRCNRDYCFKDRKDQIPQNDITVERLSADLPRMAPRRITPQCMDDGEHHMPMLTCKVT